MVMHTQSPESLNAIFTALGHPTRRAILSRLAKGEADVSELSEPFGMSQPAISRHLKVLEAAGLIEGLKDAQRRPRRLRLTAMKDAADWMDGFRKLWERRLDNLDRHLASRKTRGEKK